MVKITMKSILAALVSSNQHSPTHKSRMQMKRIMLPVVIALSSLLLFITHKDTVIFANNYQESYFFFI